MLFFQIPSRSTGAVCFSLSMFTQHGSTGTAHIWQLDKIRVTNCKPHLHLHSQKVGRGSSSYLCMAEHFLDFLEQNLLLRASDDPGCTRMASQSFLAFAALGSSPSCSSLALFLCFALDLPWLSSPVQPPFPLPVW